MHRLAVLLLVLPAGLLAQTAALRGVVTDETGAVIPLANVTVSGTNVTRSATTGNDGSYLITGLPPGDYTVQAAAPNLALPQPARVSLSAGLRTLNLQLRVAALVQQIAIEENGNAGVNTDASSNVSARVIAGDALDALSDNPEDLAADLQALAGPAAGPNGGSVFIDGFSGGELPPKDSIREIRINQNPFSPEYDRIGFGRIEILTKPGTDKFRGSIAYNYMGDFWNSRNPYAAQKAPLQLHEFRGNVGGSLNRRTSFTLDVSHDHVENGSIVNTVTLDPQTLAVTPLTAVPVTPQRRTLASPRIDYQLSEKHTLTARYQYSHTDIRNAGIGSFDLPSRAYQTLGGNHTVQLTETAVLGATVNESRFQYNRALTETIPDLSSPTTQVLGSFTGGGAQTGHAFNTQSSYEAQNYTTMIRGRHVVKFGIRLRVQSIESISPQNFNGTFTFGGGIAPVLDADLHSVVDSSGQPVVSQIQSIERYRRTLQLQRLGYSPAQIRALGGGATQFSVSAGIPGISGNQTDVGVFLGDDWKVRPNFTVNLGLRYEAQTNIHDWRDWAPRVGLAWAPGRTTGKQPKTVLRAGFGLFYDRFGLFNVLNARRYNGVIQQQYVVTNPDFFPAIPSVSELAFRTPQVIRVLDSSLRAPYVLQTAFTVERQLPRGSTLAVTYSATRGLHILRSLDINAPLPGTFDPTVRASGVFPFGSPSPLFLLTSSGIYNQNQLSLNVNARVNREISLTGVYMLNRARSDTDGLGTFPANPYNYSGEYGPASSDIRHTVSLNGTIDTLWNLRFSPLLSMQSGAPFDITTGSDLFGTTLFNARPRIAADPNKSGLIATPYGMLDPNPGPGAQILSRNYGRGPGQVSVNVRVTRTFGFGGEPRRRSNGGETNPTSQASPAGAPASGVPGGGGQPSVSLGGPGGPPGGRATSHPYNLSVSLSVRNLLNHTNPGPIIGNITSPLFGRANQMAGGPGGGGFSENANNRRLEMQLRLAF